jgi:hypothetical protein
MVWSNDLAKLKQSLRAGEGKAAPAPPPKAKQPPPPARKSLEEEDAVFLAAMGRAGAAAPRVEAEAPKAEAAPPKAGPTTPAAAAGGQGGGPDGFGEAMRGLGGVRQIRPLGPPRPRAAAQKAEPQGRSGAAAAAPPPPPPGPAAQKADGVFHLLPERIQLAAGMTIDVDCVLDLRRHSEADAGERLKERVLDGACLGWRTMQVILGNSEPLRRVLLDYMASPPASPLANYGEAPVPMGGPQAWVLYFCQAPTQDLDG